MKRRKGGDHNPITELIIEDEQTIWKIEYSNVGMLDIQDLQKLNKHVIFSAEKIYKNIQQSFHHP